MQGKERCKEEERKRETRGKEFIKICLIKLIGFQLYHLLRMFVKCGISHKTYLVFGCCAVAQELSEEDRQKKEELELLVQRAQELLTTATHNSAQHLTASSERLPQFF